MAREVRPQPGPVLVADPLPWANGLPDPIGKADGYVELDPALAAAVLERMALADRWPQLCAAHVEAQRDLDRAWHDGEMMIADTSCRLELQSVRAEAWAWWEVLTISGAALAGGLVLGLVAGFAAGM